MIKALVVDDDEDLLDMVTMMLKANGMEVFTLSGGSQFFEALETIKPHIVVMDIFLGDSDGRDLCREAKSRPEFSAIPVILYSAGNINKSMIDQVCADNFMPKPFDMDMMVSRIRALAAA